MMIYIFLRLSTVKILPRVADHAKNAAPRRSLPREASTFRAGQGSEEELNLE